MKKKIYYVLIPLYIILIIWYTVLGRGLTLETKKLELFWSYREWFAGDTNIGLQIIGNIALFAPLGFMLACIKKKKWTAVAVAFLLSCIIETTQLVTMRGLFEFDDIVDNTFGALLGFAFFRLCGNRKIGSGLTLLAVAGVAYICFAYKQPMDKTPMVCGFQIDQDLSGFFLVYNRDTPYSYEISLKSTINGQRIKPAVEYGIERQDVDTYFSCEYDFSKCGFLIKDLPDTGEYEFEVKYNPFVAIKTDVYIKDGRIWYTEPSSSNAPAIDADFVKNGYLLVCRPDYHCWIYQYEGALYWVADKDFYFDPSGSTYIQYQLWTTQTENLPQHRLERGHLWDNIGGSFESHELDGDFDNYRVMKRELPKAYAITAIVTGYYENNHWLWSNYFRPVYDL